MTPKGARLPVGGLFQRERGGLPFHDRAGASGGRYIDQALVGGAAPLQLEGLARLHEGAIYEHVDGIQQVSHGQVVGDALGERVACESGLFALCLLGPRCFCVSRQVIVQIACIAPNAIAVAFSARRPKAAQAFGCSKGSPPERVTSCARPLARISARRAARVVSVPPSAGWLSGLWQPGQWCEHPCTNTA